MFWTELDWDIEIDKEDYFYFLLMMELFIADSMKWTIPPMWAPFSYAVNMGWEQFSQIP